FLPAVCRSESVLPASRSVCYFSLSASLFFHNTEKSPRLFARPHSEGASGLIFFRTYTFRISEGLSEIPEIPHRMQADTNDFLHVQRIFSAPSGPEKNGVISDSHSTAGVNHGHQHIGQRVVFRNLPDHLLQLIRPH